MDMSVRRRNANRSADVDAEMNDAYQRGLKQSRQLWYAWIEPVLRAIQPVGIYAVVITVAVLYQTWAIHDLKLHQTDSPPITVVVDPSKTHVLRTIELRPEKLAMDQTADMNMLSDWLTLVFGVTSDPRAAADRKRRARFRVKTDSQARTVVDAYLAQNDPIKLGANGTIDVTNVSIVPAIGDHHYTLEWTLQPYDPAGHPGIAQDFKGDVLLKAVLPKNADEATRFYPYTFVSEFSWGLKAGDAAK